MFSTKYAVTAITPAMVVGWIFLSFTVAALSTSAALSCASSVTPRSGASSFMPPSACEDDVALARRLTMGFDGREDRIDFGGLVCREHGDAFLLGLAGTQELRRCRMGLGESLGGF